MFSKALLKRINKQALLIYSSFFLSMYLDIQLLSNMKKKSIHLHEQ